VLKGRLGLDSARIPHKDRNGLLWLAHGQLTVVDGTLRFTTKGDADWTPGAYDIAFQDVSCILLEPGTTVSHDALRLLARHGTGLVATGVDGVRLYASMPFGPDRSAVARTQVTRWADPATRLEVARKMYALRLGEILPGTRIEQLRGMEGIRARKMYALLAERHGVRWTGRAYDREKPEETDRVNQAVNHASTAVVACAHVATAAIGALPQLGFIHEDSGISFVLDVADLYRDEVTLPCAFIGVREAEQSAGELERIVRRTVGAQVRRRKLVSAMIDRIREILDVDDAGGDP
jgi:CRISPR-associated protein Cas1